MNKFKRGFTLIELIISLALMSVISVFVLGFILPLMNNYQNQITVRHAKDLAQLSMSYLKEEIHCATKEIKTGSDGPNVYTIKQGNILTNNSVKAMDMDVTGYKIELTFTPENQAVSVNVLVLDNHGKSLYTLTSKISSTDPNVIYSGQASDSLSLEKRVACH